MASNGYVRRDCTGCLFYSTGKGYGEECTLKAEGFASEGMRWVSASDYINYPEVKEKHDEPCEHRVDKNKLKEAFRKLFGFSEEIGNG